MPIATRTFRVFVSSTFEDLTAERDALQRDLFPKLRQLCEENGARFQAIDLRWGVRDEAALDQQTMEICLREIERCQQTRIKPNFIVLLGERYGWRPLAARIEAEEFDRVCGRVANAADQRLINDWYERDDNAVPAEYLLKPRSGAFVDKDRWGEVELALHRILLKAALDAGLAGEKLIKYEVSATHQEIFKGLGATEEDRKHVFAFFRDPAPGVSEDPELTALKKYLREKIGGRNICAFSASDLAKLCADVEEVLKRVILAEAGNFKSRPGLDLEIEAHEAFASDRARHFTGRKNVLEAISRHIRGGESRPLVVHGPSGCGKSSIVAAASAQAKAEMHGAVHMQRFIGITPEASSGITLLHSLCEQLALEYGVTEETPVAFQPLVVAFHERMTRATAERPLVLLLDALDQLRADDEARACTWVWQNLPPHVSLVVSTTEIPTGIENAPRVAVEEFPVSEAEEVLAAWLGDAKRNLQNDQREKLLAYYTRCGLPLYLKLAFEVARRWRSLNTAETCVLGNDAGGMIDVLFDRLSEESNHGRIMVNRSLGFLAAARYGLTEDEMLDMLAADDELWEDFSARAHHAPPARSLPVIVWSRLFLDLEPYLNERAAPGGNVMTFYHRQVAEQAAARFLDGEKRRERHRALAAYFSRQADPHNDKQWKGHNPHWFAELPFHLTHAELWPLLEATLADAVFCEAKFRLNGPFDLREDCQRGLRLRPSFVISATERAIVGGLGAFVERPELCLQTLVNRLAWLAREEAVVQSSVERAMRVLDERGCWLQAESAYPRMDLDSTSVPFQIDAMAECLSADERFIVVVGEDRRIRLVDLNQGSYRESRGLTEASGRVLSILETAPGDRLAWLDAADTLRVERCTQTLQVRHGEHRICFLPGHGLVAVNAAGDLVAWKMDNNDAEVLVREIATPASVLKASGNGLLLCVAGKSPQSVLVFVADTRIELRLEVVWRQEQIVDADLDARGETVLCLLRDRTLRRISVHDGKPVGESCRYEQGRPAAILGAPLRCAVGVASTQDWAFVATRDGHIGAWNWGSSEFRRLPDWRTERQLEIALFTCLRESGHLVVGQRSEARLLTQASQSKEERFHQSPVGACVVTDRGQFVSMSEYDGTVCWFSNEPGLNLLVRQSHPGLTAMAPVPQSNDVLLGNHRGWCWRQPPDRAVNSEEVFCLFDRKVVALASRNGKTYVAADGSGRIMQIDTGKDDPALLRHGAAMIDKQIALQPAGAAAICWSLRESSERGNITSRLSLVTGADRETEILNERERIGCFATAPDRNLLCVGSYYLRLLEINNGKKPRNLLQRDTAVKFVSFVAGNRRLAVIQHHGPWLEIWDLTEGLPTVAGADLPGTITSFGARGDRILLGFESGELLRLRLRGHRAMQSRLENTDAPLSPLQAD
jgi:hypothetical protein